MLSNDLLSYSIMSNGDKAIVHSLPHYASLADSKLKGFTLPPITSYVRLTENSLDSLNRSLPSRSPSESTPPSLTSSSSSVGSPFSSPRIPASSFGDASLSYGLIIRPDSPLASPVTDKASLAQKKRRQRLGPSCDNCRSRKVKCNAEVVMVSRNFTNEKTTSSEENGDYEKYLSLSELQKEGLGQGQIVNTSCGYMWVLTNSKLIKYKPCMSCASKEFKCSFSKGFTKEDIVHSKRHNDIEEGTPSKERSLSMPNRVQKKQLSESGFSISIIGKPSTRKSSCAACRKRKVKCVISSPHGKCTGCTKKDILCTF